MKFNRCLYTFLDGKFDLSQPERIALMIAVMLGSALIAYMLGSINPAVLISKFFYHDDIRRRGSGNAGTTNMLRTFGKGAAALTLFGDMLKCAIAIIIGAFLWVDGSYIAGVFCVLGHVFPCWHKFRGGKGVAVTAMAVLMTDPIVFLILFAIFAVILFGTKYMSLASIMTALLYPLILSSWNVVTENNGGMNVIMAFLMTAIVVVMHRGNIKRLLNKTEPKVSFKKKKANTYKEQESAEETNEKTDDGTKEGNAQYRKYLNKKDKKGNGK